MRAKRDERPGRYATQARTYDLTRSASPTVVRLVSKYLGPANGRRLLDIAAGTANYTRVMHARGFDVLAVDAEFEMVSRSVGKIGRGRQVLSGGAGEVRVPGHRGRDRAGPAHRPAPAGRARVPAQQLVVQPPPGESSQGRAGQAGGGSPVRGARGEGEGLVP